MRETGSMSEEKPQQEQRRNAIYGVKFALAFGLMIGVWMCVPGVIRLASTGPKTPNPDSMALSRFLGDINLYIQLESRSTARFNAAELVER
jgi:hypothetical protein